MVHMDVFLFSLVAYAEDNLVPSVSRLRRHLLLEMIAVVASNIDTQKQTLIPAPKTSKAETRKLVAQTRVVRNDEMDSQDG
jgi:hypothetical protein